MTQPDPINQYAAGLLILSLTSVLAMAMLSVLFIRSYLRRRLVVQPAEPPPKDPTPIQYRQTVFEKPCRWLVVRNGNVAAIQMALDLHNATPCSWGEGLSKLALRKLFVSPPVDGWILVIGQALPDPADDVDECYRFITRLSRDLGQVQFYSANRAVNHHAWVRAEGGRVSRGYAWAGETLWNEGPLTPAEAALGLKCFDYGEGPVGFVENEAETHALNAEKVLLLAARWSLDPNTLDEKLAAMEKGLSGDLSHISRP